MMAVCPASPTTTRPKEAMLNGLKIPQLAASETLTMKASVLYSSTLGAGQLTVMTKTRRILWI